MVGRFGVYTKEAESSSQSRFRSLGAVEGSEGSRQEPESPALIASEISRNLRGRSVDGTRGGVGVGRKGGCCVGDVEEVGVGSAMVSVVKSLERRGDAHCRERSFHELRSSILVG